jgi:hypothetical protein
VNGIFLNKNNPFSIEASSPVRLIPKFPVAFQKTSPSPVLNTESTTYIDSEEDSLIYGDSAEKSYIFSKRLARCDSFQPSPSYPLSVPPELDNTASQPNEIIQPDLTNHNHSHTRSYDFNSITPITRNVNPYW